jgi:hypothetical protein
MKTLITLFISILTFSYFSQDLVEFKDEQDKIGFKNSEGTIVIPAQYDYSESFVNGLAVVEKEYKKGVINTKGQVIIPIEFEFVFAFEKNLAVVGKDYKKGVYNSEGKKIFDAIYEDITIGLNYLLVIIDSYENKWDLYDFKGQKVNFPKFDFIDFANQNLIIGSIGGTKDIRDNYSGGKWYIHDSTGKKIERSSL